LLLVNSLLGQCLKNTERREAAQDLERDVASSLGGCNITFGQEHQSDRRVEVGTADTSRKEDADEECQRDNHRLACGDDRAQEEERSEELNSIVEHFLLSSRKIDFDSMC